MHHRRFDFQVAARGEKFADGLNDPRSRDEHDAAVFVGDEVEVALAVFLFLVGQTMEFFRQEAAGLWSAGAIA